MSTASRGDGLASHLRQTTDALGGLVAGHLRLARLELRGDLSAAGAAAAWVAGFGLLAGAGYLFVALAVAALLEPRLGWSAALAVIGLLQLVAGGLGAAWAARRLRAVGVLDHSARAADRSLGRPLPTREEAHVR
jgi:uncharacterized membrane protein YqjE